MSTETRTPEMNDCLIAGIPLRDAVALERAIAAEPDKEPAYWWQIFKALQQSAPGAQKSSQAPS